jgi:6-phosphogluconate dehydrogenase
MKTQADEIGMADLGVMGRNLRLNMAEHGFSVAGYDKDAAKVEALGEESKERDVRGVADIKEFNGRLRPPRAVIMPVPAGPPVDSLTSTYERIDAKSTFHTEREKA